MYRSRFSATSSICENREHHQFLWFQSQAIATESFHYVLFLQSLKDCGEVQIHKMNDIIWQQQVDFTLYNNFVWKEKYFYIFIYSLCPHNFTHIIPLQELILAK